MGGNLLSHFGLTPKRIPQEDYDLLIERLTAVVLLKSGARRVRALRCFSEKKSHGDLDLLIEIFPGENDWMAFCRNLTTVEPIQNGHTISFEVWGYQIDFNFAAPEIYECAYNYYNFESGMLIGVLANNLGCKYGHDGLYLRVPLSNLAEGMSENEFKEILVTTDTAKIFELFDLDYKAFQIGFNTLEELFAWFCQSKLFIKKLWLNLDSEWLEK